MRTAALYLRSSKDRADMSIQAQRTQLRELALQRRYSIVAEFVDAVESGKDEDRPGFQALLQAVKSDARGWDTLLVLDTSRIARRRHIAILFEETECRKRGITIVYRSLPESDPITEMLLKSILQAMDEWHSLTSRAKGLAGMAANVAAGWRAGGKAPHGYRLERVSTGAVRDGLPVTKSRLVLSPEAPRVAAFLRARIAGTPRTLAGRQSGLKAPTTTLLSIERNALVYAGCTVWNQRTDRRRRPREEWQVQAGTHEALIAEADAERLLVALERPSGRRERKRGKSLLSGILRAPDGRKWEGCGDRYRYRPEEGGSSYVRREDLERAVVAHVIEDSQSPAFVRALTLAAQAAADRIDAADLEPARRRLAEIGRKVTRMAELAAETDEPGPFVRRMAELETERKGIETGVAEAEAEHASRAALRNVTEHQVRRTLVEIARAAEQDGGMRDALFKLLESVELDPETRDCVVRYRVKVASPRGCAVIPLSEPLRAWG